jgi:hypothetical protein
MEMHPRDHLDCSRRAKKMKSLLYRAVAIGLFVIPAAVVQGKPDKITVCHVPVMRAMDIPSEALSGHMSHGDFLVDAPAGASCELVPM